MVSRTRISRQKDVGRIPSRFEKMKVSELAEERKRTIADKILGTCDTNSKTAEELRIDGERVD